MIKTDLHMHTKYCDGKNTVEEMVHSAIDKGFNCVGISPHSYTFFDESYCMSREDTEKYKSEMSWLKRKYSKKINLLCGIEQDYYSDEPTDDYDYVIGSVHYLKIGDEYVPVDESAKIIKDAVNKHFNGDIYAFLEKYFEIVGEIVNKTNCSIIGHFDLVTKFIEKEKLFDVNNLRYVTAWKAAADKLIGTGKVFEINTGAISRGYRTSAYPSAEIIDYIKKKEGKLILSSDAHSALSIGFEFGKYEKYIDDVMLEL